MKVIYRKNKPPKFLGITAIEQEAKDKKWRKRREDKKKP